MKKLTTTAIATLAVLIAVGVAFALWADVLKIHVEVQTGDVDVEFGDTFTITEYVGFPDGSGGWNFVQEDSDSEAKDVGDCQVQLVEIENEEDTSLGTSAGDNDLDLEITLSNAYPGYRCDVQFEVQNTGSIPVKLYFYDSDNNRITLPATINIGGGAVICELSGTDEAQVHPDDSATYTLSCVVQQSAAEDSTYSTQIYIQARQWNEPP
ncbi:hypothetical protein [Pyrobaculum ferrireducens]|uniref:Uncharacterized protein n=1 Tax=Pyrobaculum ferrireducens TaxID=1104324 RepID=G7VCD6_9CREN|nr:hypothetical protein [Pyrobaculum ferrireducens]AET32556.1 hypothetical protein P186_1123 [Pyrobaculum ferrireducens]